MTNLSDIWEKIDKPKYESLRDNITKLMEEAHKMAYNAAALEYHGIFARLNETDWAEWVNKRLEER